MTEALFQPLPALEIPAMMEVPLYQDKHGAVRVKGTRVHLDLIIYAFNQGLRPEEIIERFDTLELANVYAVINYYLHYRAEVDDYIRQLDERGDARRREARSRPEYQAWEASLRARMEAKRQETELADASLAD
jgi:uncharacterized protein (DUF433 family)